MNKESPQKYQDFAKSFKAALTNSSIYFSNHPVFSHSVENLKAKILEIIGQKTSLTIEVKPESLIVDEQVLEGKGDQELANFLHLRRIKRLTIKSEATEKDLSEFLLLLSSNPKEILTQGGIKKLLQTKKIENVALDELDYSSLLRGDGTRIKDVWSYLLSSQPSQDRSSKDDGFSSSFQETVDKFGIKEVLEDDNLLRNLISIIQTKNKEKAKEILKKMGTAILKTGKIGRVESREKLKKLFSFLSSEELADLILDSFNSKATIDQSSFDLFSFLIPSEVHEKAAMALSEKVKNNNSKINAEKIKNILSSLKKEGIVSTYCKHLLSDSSSAGPPKANFVFDRKHLTDNYRLTLLDLFFYEKKPLRLELVLEKITDELKIDFPKKSEYIEKIAKIYKLKQNKEKIEISLNSAKKIWGETEKNIFSLQNPNQFSFLTDFLEKSQLEVGYYLSKIERGQFNELVFKLFFRFFPDQLGRLMEVAAAKKDNSGYLKKFLVDLAKAGHPLVLEIFKNLYSLGSFQVKVMVLEQLKDCAECSQDFLAVPLRSRNFILRKKAAALAAKFPGSREKAAKMFFDLPNILGFKSNLILENIEIAAEIYNPAVEPFLEKISKYKFFWNRKVRKKAAFVLRKYYEKPD